MKTKIVASILCILITFCITYFVLLIISSGDSAIIGLHLSVSLIKFGISGFLLAVIFDTRIKRDLLYILCVCTNLVVGYFIASGPDIQAGSKLGETIVLTYVNPQGAGFGLDYIMLIIFSSLLLFSLYIFIINKWCR